MEGMRAGDVGEWGERARDEKKSAQEAARGPTPPAASAQH